MRRIEGYGLPLVALLVAGPALADPPAAPARPARLVYTRGKGAEQCPDEPALRRAVTSRLGYDPWSDAAPRSIAAVVRLHQGRLAGEVTVSDASGATLGARRLTAASDDCDELVAAMALAVSLAIDPEVLHRPTPPRDPSPGAAPSASASQTPISPPPPPAPPPPPPPLRTTPSLAAKPLLPAPRARSAPASSRPSPIRWHVGVSTFVSGGASPGVSGGFLLRAGLRWKALSTSVEGRADVPSSIAATGGGAVSAGLIAANLVPCFHVGPVAACGLGTFGALRGSGSGVRQPLHDVTPFVALGLRLGAELAFSRVFSAGVHADLAGTLTRTDLVLDDRVVWTTPPASATLGIGVTAHFP